MLCYQTSLYAQNAGEVPCGTQPMTNQEYLTMAQQTQGDLNPTLTPDNIPIHITIIDNDGQTDWFPSLDFSATEDALNSFFDNGMSFYFCDITVVGSGTLIDFDNTEWQELMDLHFVDDAINLYCVNSIDINGFLASGVAQYPDSPFNNMIIVRNSAGPATLAHTLAHELGHYFGLPHTFDGSGYVQDEICLGPFLQVNCDINTVIAGLCPLNCGPMQACISHGDGFCDTPADPGTLLVNPDGCYTTGGCTTITCIEPNDPLGEPYSPDITNIMSYYVCPPQHFSNDQNNFMLDVLYNHPNKAFLWDAMPQCVDFYSSFGFIGAVTNNFPLGDDPFKSLKVDLINLASSEVCTNTTSNSPSDEGYYELFHCSFFPTEDIDIMVVPHKNNPITAPSENPNLLHLFAVTVQDVLDIQEHIVGGVELVAPYQWLAADVNYDGAITTIDAYIINKQILLLDDAEFKIGSWRYVPERYLQDPNFHADFIVNPFDAVWVPPGIGLPKPYLPNTGQNSYMNKVEMNLSAPEATEEINWSFVAIKTGDANSDGEFIEFTGNDDNSILSLPDHSLIKTGETFLLEFSGYSDADIVALQMGLFLAPETIEILGFEIGDLPNYTLDDFGLTNMDRGLIRTTWIEKNIHSIDFRKEKKLFSVNVKALKDIENICEVITLSSTNETMPTFFVKKDGDKQIGEIRVDLQYKPLQHRVTKIYPVPLTKEINFEIALATKEKVTLQIIDIVGTTIESNYDLEEGKHMISMSNLEEIHPGVFYYNLQLGDEFYTGSLIKIKN